MLNNIINKKDVSDVFKRQVLSYIMVLAIVIAVNFIVYINSIHMIKNNLSDTNHVYLDRIKLFIDSQISEIKSLSTEIKFNNDVQMCIESKRMTQGGRACTYYRINQDIKYYMISRNAINCLGIYFPNDDTIITSLSSYYLDDWYRIYADPSLQGIEKLKSMIENPNSTNYGVLPGGSLVICERLCGIDYKGIEAAVLVLVEMDTVLKGLSNNGYMFDDGTMFVIDSSGEIVFSDTPDKHSEIMDKVEFTKNTTTRNIKIDGKEYMLSFVKSDILDWYYVSVISTYQFIKPLNLIKSIIVFCLFISLVIGFIVALWLAWHNYKPIQRLVAILGDSRTPKNEYDFIENYILNIQKEKVEISQKLCSQKQVLKEYFLTRLLRGSISKAIDKEQLCEYYDFNCTDAQYIVMLLKVEDLGEIFFKKNLDNIAVDDLPDALVGIVRRILDTVISSRCQYESIYIDDMVCCLLSFKEDDGKLQEVIEMIANDVQKYMRKNYGISVSVALSNIFTDVDNIHVGYYQAIEAMEYIELLGIEKVIKYADMNTCKIDDEKWFDDTEERIKNCIKTMNFEDAHNIIKEFFDKYYENEQKPSLQIIQCRIFGFINAMIYAINELNRINGNIVLEQIKPVNRLLNCHSVIELRTEMECIIDDVKEIIEKNKDTNRERLIDEIISFIKENFADCNISASAIASHFNISASYLSRFFKSETGMGVLEYIHRTRLEAAKKLIISGKKLSIKEIAEQTGFYNSIAFIRIFKKYENITPGEFKAINQ